MKHFLIKTLIFAIIPVILTYLFIVLFYNKLPAPRLTPSYSLNEKLFYFDNFDSEYLTIGSSIALNNMNSEAIISGFNTDDYLNMASWGVKPTDVYAIIKGYTDNYKPKIIIFASNEIDFQDSDQDIKESQFIQRMKYPYPFITPSYYFAHFDLPYYYKYYSRGKIYKHNDTLNESVKFDEFGGVTLDINKKLPVTTNWQWDRKVDMNLIEYVNYAYLDSISKLAFDQDIHFVFIQTPIREGMINDTYKINIKKHCSQVHEILSKYDHQFINATEYVWPDSLFFDYGHFHEEAAKKFTSYCVNKIVDNYNLNISTAINDKNPMNISPTTAGK